jgi:multidrug efflux pump subunit AcrA (membrane-fusion protein)
MNRKVLIGIGVVITLSIAYFAVKGRSGADAADIMVTVQKGEFQVDVETTGELEAKNSVKIIGPTKLREFRIHQVKIDAIVEEGTEVKKGEWIATLDRSELMNKIQDAQLEVDKKMSQYVQTKLDTTLQMRESRDQLINLEYAIEEKQIILEQSQYEPPATIKQAEIELIKATRALSQAQENYKIKKQQNIAKMQEVSANLRKEQNDLTALTKLMGEFTITAPEDGMLIYRKGWDGKAMKEGSTISAWDPVVAELPDLSVMLSKTYINEVDVRKIKPGQRVEVGLDAFPEKKFTGKVIKVANVGEQRPNSDAKVFQVNIEIDGQDDLLRPSMTTSNKIIISVDADAIFVPLECLHTENDSITFVYKKEGISTIKQEVQVGGTNVNEAIILAGVAEGDRLHLSIPTSSEGKAVKLIPDMAGKRLKEEPVAAEKPKESTITLPDGRVITVPADGQRRGDRRQMRRERPATASGTGKEAATDQTKTTDEN